MGKAAAAASPGPHGTAYVVLISGLYTAAAALSLVLVASWVRETKGRTLGEM